MLEFYYEHFFELLILSYLKHNINKRQRKKEICTQRRNFLSKIKKKLFANLFCFSASKFAAYGFTEALNEEIIKLGKPGVKTTTVNPMFVDTGLVKDPKDK
jgi:NAD(P)-dependent dehydrogenase (short-subunit alcohol dehydrogenase family)